MSRSRRSLHTRRDSVRTGRTPHVDVFEANIAAPASASHALALGSGTAALHLGLLGLGDGPGNAVIAAMSVDPFGRCADYDEIIPGLQDRGIPLIKDAVLGVGRCCSGARDGESDGYSDVGITLGGP